MTDKPTDAMIEAVRLFLKEGTRVTQRGGEFFTQVIERKDKSDPYYRLCVALENYEARPQSAAPSPDVWALAEKLYTAHCVHHGHSDGSRWKDEPYQSRASWCNIARAAIEALTATAPPSDSDAQREHLLNAIVGDGRLLLDLKAWLQQCHDWLLETDLDMQCPMDADPLDLIARIDKSFGLVRLSDSDAKGGGA